MALNSAPEPVRIASMVALVRALSAHGGYSEPRQAYAWIKTNTDLHLRMPNDTKLSTEVHFEREIRFARQELADAGLLASVTGSWRLLDSASINFTSEDARRIARENTRRRRARRDAADAPSLSTLAQPSGRSRPSTGPKPVAWSGTVTRELGPAATYAFRFEGSDIWKIGFASDVESRLRAVNQHVPVELLGGRWILALTKPWPSAEHAHLMEQYVLGLLKAERTVYERVRCSDAVLIAAWQAAFVEVSANKGA